jgi:hypothetical protein
MENVIEFVKEQRKVSHANYKKKCEYCGREFFSVRIDAKFCTALCRVKYFQNGGSNEPKKREKKATPNREYKEFDFYARINEYDDDWREFRNYLNDTFGWKKYETTSFKKVKELAEEWNEQHKEQITLNRRTVWHDGEYVSKVTFSVK